jgi:hypothetical protein
VKIRKYPDTVAGTDSMSFRTEPTQKNKGLNPEDRKQWAQNAAKNRNKHAGRL